MLNLYDYTKFTEDPILQTIHRKGMRDLPELGMMPSVRLNGTGYKTPALKSRADGEIFVPIGEGVISQKSDFTMEKNEVMGIDFKVEANRRAEDQEGNLSEIAGVRRFDLETETRYRTTFERIVKQLYLGTTFEEHGFPGLPAAVKYKVDASKEEWNLQDDFDWADSAARLYSIYLIRTAPSATVEEEGAKWIWGNSQTIAPTGPKRVVEMRDEAKSLATGKNATYEAWVQHHVGGVGFGFTSDIDVIEIANVPSFRVATFFLENVLSQALTIFPGGKKADKIVIHKLCAQAMHLNVQNQNAGTRNVSIVPPKDDGAMSIKTPRFFDGTTEIDMVISEIMPATGLQTVAATTLDNLSEQVYV